MLLRFPNKNRLNSVYSEQDMQRCNLQTSEEQAEFKRDDRKTSERALRLLSIREHSVQELIRKLLAKGHQEKLVHRVIEDMKEQGLVSDQRFAESFVRGRIAKKQGPILICAELRERGVSERILEDVLTQPSEFWLQLAQEARDKRFTSRPTYADSALFAAANDTEQDGEADTHEGQKEELGEEPDGEKANEQAQAYWTRQARFLSRRGFPADLIYRVLENSRNSS